MEKKIKIPIIFFQQGSPKYCPPPNQIRVKEICFHSIQNPDESQKKQVPHNNVYAHIIIMTIIMLAEEGIKKIQGNPSTSLKNIAQSTIGAAGIEMTKLITANALLPSLQGDPILFDMIKILILTMGNEAHKIARDDKLPSLTECAKDVATLGVVVKLSDFARETLKWDPITQQCVYLLLFAAYQYNQPGASVSAVLKQTLREASQVAMFLLVYSLFIPETQA